MPLYVILGLVAVVWLGIIANPFGKGNGRR